MVSALWQDWWLNRCQETWSRILVPPLASYGTTSTLLNLSEPTSLCVKWLWSAYVLRVLWGLSKVYYLEKLLENSRCLIKCQTQGKLYNPFKLECRHCDSSSKSPSRGHIVCKGQNYSWKDEVLMVKCQVSLRGWGGDVIRGSLSSAGFLQWGSIPYG